MKLSLFGAAISYGLLGSSYLVTNPTIGFAMVIGSSVFTGMVFTFGSLAMMGFLKGFGAATINGWSFGTGVAGLIVAVATLFA